MGPTHPDEGPQTLAVTKLGPTVVIDDGLRAAFYAEWSPTAPALAVSVARPEDRGVIVARFDERGLSEPPLFWSVPPDELVDRVHWAPDGRHVAYSSRRSPHGGGHLYIADADALAGPSPSLSASEVDDLAWSPLGHALAFTAMYSDGEVVLHIAHEDDGFTPRRVELPEGVTRPEVRMSPDDSDRSAVHGWSPDGRWLAFRARVRPHPDSSRDVRIFVTSEHGSAPTLVTPRLNPRDAHAHGGAWSADGRVFTYEDISESGEAPMTIERYAVDLVEGRPGEPVFLAAGEAKLRWLPDGRLFSVEPRRRDVRAELIDIASTEEITRIALFQHRARCAHANALHGPTQRVVMTCQRDSPRYDLLIGWQPGAPEPFELDIIDLTFLLHEGWSPDGTVLAFVGDPEHGERTLYEARFPEGDVAVIERDARRFTRSVTGPPM